MPSRRARRSSLPVPGRDPWRVSRRRALVAGAAGLALIGTVIGGGYWLGTQPGTQNVTLTSSRLAVPIPAGQQVERPGVAPLAISPDGTRIVYAAVERGGRTRLFMRPLDRFESTAIEGTEGGSAPFFSPDGRWVGFYANGMLQRVSIDGGAALRICEAPTVWSASWGSDETIVFAGTTTPGGLWRVAASGGAPERLTTVDAKTETQHAYPERLPSGDILFGVITDRGWHLAKLALATKQVTALGEPGSGGAGARFVAPSAPAVQGAAGHLLYASGGGFVAVPFDPDSGVTGSPVPLLERPDVDPSGSAAFAVSSSGTLVYMPRATALPSRSLVMVDRSGRATLLSDTRAAYAHPRLSRDGRRLVVAIESETGSDIWVYDLERGSRTHLTRGGVNRFPIWSHDGLRITFQSARSGSATLYAKSVDAMRGPRAADSVRERSLRAVAIPSRTVTGVDAALYGRESAPSHVVVARWRESRIR